MKQFWVGSFALALTAVSAGAQGWVAELDGGEVRALARAANGDLVLAGNQEPGLSQIVSRVRRFTPAGTPVAAFDIGIAGATNTIVRDALTTESGEIVVCGSAREVGLTEHPWVSAWDVATGAKLWQTTPALAGADFEAIAKVPGGYIAVGAARASIPWAAYAAGFDDAGNLTWQRTYEPAQQGMFLDVASTGDGGALVTGELDYVRYLVRVDPAGNPIWSRSVDMPGASPVSVTLAADGSLFVATTDWISLDPWISRWTADGNLLWQKVFNTTIGVRVDAIEAAPDGGALLFGYFDHDPTILRIDANGAVFWHRRIALPGEYLRGGLLPTPEGGCFLSCSLEDAGVARAWVIRLGAYGGWPNSCFGTVSNVATIASPAAHAMVPEAVFAGLAAGQTAVAGVESAPSATFASSTCGDPCSDPPQYCSSLPNSVGAGSTIRSSGSTSVFANNLVLEARSLPVGTFGLFFYGTEPRSFPFGEGVVCIGGSTFRLPIVQSSAMGVSQHALDLNAPPSPAGQITPGSTFYFQHWYRDIAGGPAGFNFSNGLAATFCP